VAVAQTEIELEVGAAGVPGEYLVRVIHAAGGGEPQGSLCLDVDGMRARRGGLEASVLASGARARRGVSATEQPLRQVGQELFAALFDGPVGSVYRASLAVARERGTQLRVVLRLMAPELSVLPWEALYDPELDAYLCRKEPLVRHIPAPYTHDPLPVGLPLRILGLIASPRGLPLLDVEAEQQQLERALAGPIGSGRVELVWLAQASWDGVHERLLTERWHVLHFIGHGDYDPETDEGRLALLGEDGRADWVGANALADLLGEADPTPRLVLLNSCSSGQGGEHDLFSGTAATLVRSGIAAVAAMQFSVTDRAAIAFPRGFYTALAAGKTVDNAVRSGRIAILGGSPSTLEWVTPVLYLRGNATRLFSLAATPQPPVPSPPAAAGDQRARDATVYGLYVQALAALRTQRYADAVGLLDSLLTLEPDYRDAAVRRDAARQALRLTDHYQQARDAEDAEDWGAAIAAYEAVVAIEEHYSDASARLDSCRRRDEISSLHDELQLHVGVEQWQAAVAVSEQLARLDPTQADPDGLATQAHDALAREQQAERETARRREQIAALTEQLRAHVDAHRWQAAIDVSDRLADLEPGLVDPDGLASQARRELARREQALAVEYQRGRDAEGNGDWRAAEGAYEAVLATDGDYRDAGARRDACRRQEEIVRLQGRLGREVEAEQWQAAVVVSDEIVKLDPEAADPDGLATRARQELTRRKRGLVDTKPPAETTGAASADTERLATSMTKRTSRGPASIDGVADTPRHPEPAEPPASRVVGGETTAGPAGGLDVSERAPAKARHIRLGYLLTALVAVALIVVVVGRVVPDRDDVARPPVLDAAREPEQQAQVPSSAELLATLTGHESPVNAVAVTPDGDRIVSGANDDTVRVWDLDSGELLATLTGHETWVEAVAVTPDGDRIVSGSGDRTVRVWDLDSGELLATLTGHEDWVEAVAVTPDGDRIVSGSPDGTVRVWDLDSRELLATLTGPLQRWVAAVAVTPDGDRIVSGADDRRVRVWDLDSGELLATLTGHEDWVVAVAVTPDGDRIVSGAEDGTVRVWDLDGGELLATLTGHEDWVVAVAVTPDGDRIVSGSVDGTVRVWDLDGGELLATLTGHEDWVVAVAVTPDGDRIVSGSGDGTVRVWELPTE
jgi:hypothetical protein